MTVQKLKDAYHREPFIPFRIHYPGGAAVEVAHPEFIAFSPTGRIVTVCLPDDRSVHLDVALITALEELKVSAD